MIRQVTAAKTHFQAGSGQEAAEGRETRDTAAMEGSKQAYLVHLEEQGRATRHPAWERGLHGSLSVLLHEQGW